MLNSKKKLVTHQPDKLITTVPVLLCFLPGSVEGLLLSLSGEMQRKKHALKTEDSLVQWDAPGAYLEVSAPPPPLLEVLLCYCHRQRIIF